MIERLKLRAKVVAEIRAFFDGRGFVEVETPVRIAAPAPEPHIDCPEVSPPDGGASTYLRASPELQMKKLLAAGMDRIYQIGPCFREGERGSRHSPEFTMLEWYRRGADYITIMNDAENLVRHLSSKFGTAAADGGRRMFNRLLVRDMYREIAGWDPWTQWDQDRFDFDMATKIERWLQHGGSVFLMDYPVQAASLAKIRGDVAERWELYVDGLELANCFTELCDAFEQRRRFAEAREERRKIGEADYPIDEDFLSSLGDIGSAAGVALGVDRLMMILTGAQSVGEVRVTE